MISSARLAWIAAAGSLLAACALDPEGSSSASPAGGGAGAASTAGGPAGGSAGSSGSFPAGGSAGSFPAGGQGGSFPEGGQGGSFPEGGSAGSASEGGSSGAGQGGEGGGSGEAGSAGDGGQGGSAGAAGNAGSGPSGQGGSAGEAGGGASGAAGAQAGGAGEAGQGGSAGSAGLGGSGGEGAGGGGAGGASGAGQGGSAGSAGEGGSAGSGGSVTGRVTDGLVALYEFNEQSGTTVADTSGVKPPLDLSFDSGTAAWGKGYLEVKDVAVIQSPGPATKITSTCKSGTGLTVEVWNQPAAPASGAKNSVLVAMDKGASARNILLLTPKTTGQEAYNFFVRTSTTTTGGVGLPSPAGSLVINKIQHVVFTWSVGKTRTLYLDGAPVASAATTGDFSTWDDTYGLALANVTNGKGPAYSWQGALYLAAIYCKALSDDEVKTNFSVGPG